MKFIAIAALLSTSSAITVGSFKDKELTNEELMDPKTYQFVTSSIDEIDLKFKQCENEDKALERKVKTK